MANVNETPKAATVFDHAADLPADERAAYLDSACELDPLLRGRVEALLSADARSDGFLDEPISGGSVGEALSSLIHEQIPERIGAYSIRGVLGRGGMGVVYLAEQDSPRRTVALKVLSAITASDSLIRRFELEAEILAALEHPGIARVFERGVAQTPSGPAHYFAMELVRGEAITAFAIGNGLDLASRIRLLATVCDAVQHIHAKGVIHRDLKPSNILVGGNADEPMPKVVDFGIARAAQAASMTLQGQLIGTLAFMSPEQAAGDTDNIDIRSDVYSLGVVLLELLTDERAFAEAGDDTTRLLEAVRAHDGLSPPVRCELAPDLRAIVRRATRHDPEDRYASASALADDLRRFLDDLPVAARLPTRIEQVSRFARRNRGLVAASVVVVAAIGIGGGIGLWQWRRAERGEWKRSEMALVAQQADAAAFAKAESIAGMVERLADKVGTGRSTRNFALQDALEVMSESLDGHLFPDGPEREISVHRTFASICYYNGGLQGLAVKHYRRALDLSRESPKRNDKQHAELANLLGNALNDMGESEQAESLYLEAISVGERSGKIPANEFSVVYESLGRALKGQGKFDLAADAYRKAIGLFQHKSSEPTFELVELQSTLGEVFREAGHLAEARRTLEETLLFATPLMESDRRVGIKTRRYLARVEHDTGHPEVGEAMQRDLLEWTERVYGRNHQDYATALIDLAKAVEARGDLGEAESLLRQALAAVEKASRPMPKNRMIILGELADLLEGVPGREGEAEALRKQADEARERVTGGNKSK